VSSRNLLLVGCVTAACWLLPFPAGATTWVRARSAHFEVLSDAGEAPARQTAERLERLRQALVELLPPRLDAERPITLLLLADEGLFARLVSAEHRQHERVAGFFRGGSDRDYAVVHLAEGLDSALATAEHEYAHLVQNGALPAQPVWVAEGLAELLSGGALGEGVAELGADRPEHERRLQRGSLMPIESLLEVRYDSAEYLGDGSGGPLYAQSWGLVRWAIHQRGLAGLCRFLEAVADGAEPTTAFEVDLGPLAEVRLDGVPAGPLFRLPLGEPDPKVTTATPAVAEVEHCLADLLLHDAEWDAALRHLKAALAADPGHVPSRVARAKILVARKEWTAARAELDRALEIEPGAPAALLCRARLRLTEARDQGEPLDALEEAAVVSDLETAVAGCPQLYEAALLLAELRPQPYRQRIALLEPVFDRQPDQPDVARVLADLYIKSWDLDAARQVLFRAREMTRSSAYRFLFERLLERIGGFAAGTVEVEGRLVHLGCRPDGSLRFTIAVAPEMLRLEAPSGRSFLARGPTGEEPLLVCGSQELPLRARYALQPGRSDVDGTLLWLEVEAPPR
jgi:tetratricopeptide (TPR) repeat protein